MSSIETIQDNSIKISGYFQITHPNDKSIGEIFEITLIEYDPSSNQNKIIGYSIVELDYFIEIIQGKNYFYIEGFDQGYKVCFEENINDFYKQENINDFYKQEILATNLPELVQKHLNENWCWGWLSDNPGIPIEFIEETLYKVEYNWAFKDIGRNPNITPEFIRKHLHEIKEDGWFWLSLNKGIPIEFIDETFYQPGYNWDWDSISGNINITPEFVREHLGEIKKWKGLSKNSGIPIEFIEETLGQEGYNWNWDSISENINITPEFVREHLGEIKKWNLLSENLGIPIEFIDDTLGQEGYEWKWYEIVENKNITPEFIRKHRHEIKEWDWDGLSRNSGIPIEFIEETLYQEGYEWKWGRIEENPNITPEFVEKHRHEIKNWKSLAFNRGIPIEFIDETLYQGEYKWVWGEIEKNPNITPKFVQKHLHEINEENWFGLSLNKGIPIEFIDETWSQPGYKWDIRAISGKKPHNKQPMIKAARP